MLNTSLRISASRLAIVGLVLALNLPVATRAQMQSGGEHMTQKEIDVAHMEHMVDVGGRKLHAKVYGEGAPTIVLVSGFGAEQWTWQSIIPALAELSTVVTYDRPGYGKSELGAMPCHAMQAATDLNVLLEKLKVPQSFVIVGHSYGCRVARLFAANYPDNVRAVLFEDGQHPRILKAQLEALSGTDLEQLEKMVTMMSPPENPRTEMDFVQISLQQALECGPMPNVPFVVLTAGDRTKMAPPMFSPEGKQKMIALGLEMQKELAALVPEGKHIIVENSGHIIHRDKPEAVISEIVALVEQIRNDT